MWLVTRYLVRVHKWSGWTKYDNIAKWSGRTIYVVYVVINGPSGRTIYARTIYVVTGSCGTGLDCTLLGVQARVQVTAGLGFFSAFIGYLIM